MDGHFPLHTWEAKKMELPGARNEADVQREANLERVPNGISSTWFPIFLLSLSAMSYINICIGNLLCTSPFITSDCVQMIPHWFPLFFFSLHLTSRVGHTLLLPAQGFCGTVEGKVRAHWYQYNAPRSTHQWGLEMLLIGSLQQKSAGDLSRNKHPSPNNTAQCCMSLFP